MGTRGVRYFEGCLPVAGGAGVLIGFTMKASGSLNRFGETLNPETLKTVVAILASIAAIIAGLYGVVTRPMMALLKAELAKTEANLKTQMIEMGSGLRTNTNDVEKRLTAQIVDVEKRLSTEIRDVEKHLNDRIDARLALR